MTYEPRWPQEFTRPSIATYIDGTGTLKTAAINEPRPYFDPATLQYKGLLVEGESTNLLKYSEQLDNAAWVKGSANVTANATAAPDGTFTADKIVESSTSSVQHFVYQTYASFTAGRLYTFTCYLKAVERTDVKLQFNSAAFGVFVQYRFTLVGSGSVTAILAGTNSSGTISSVGGGWYRCSISAQATATIASQAVLMLFNELNSDTYVGNGTSGVCVWGAQLEDGPFATSYIPTTTAPVTRYADTPTFWPVDKLLPGNASQQERTLEVATARLGGISTAGIRNQWNPDTCPANMLPWLAWAFNVDEWDATWPDEYKRKTIADSVALHRVKGTVNSIRRVLANAGYGDATIFEGVYGELYNATYTHNGFITHGNPDDWAEYRVVLTRPMTNQQAAQVRRILGYTAPARCDLKQLVYTQANNNYNGAITYDGTFNHGTA